MIGLPVLLAALTSVVVIAIMLGWARNLLPIDRVTHRSLHAGEIPRSGGIGIVFGSLWAVPQLLASNVDGSISMLLVGLGMLVSISFIDDYRPVSALSRLLVQVFSAICLLIWVGMPVASLFSIVVVVAIVWSVNLFNFMDGMDGLAGSMALVGFTALAVVGGIAGDEHYAMAMFSIAGAAAGFLLFNAPPARIFMGDVGSTFLGYMAVAASLWGWHAGIFPYWVPLLVFAPFWVDATVTLLRRLALGERVWEAHRSHFYQRAVLAGWPVKGVLLIEVVLMILCAGAAIAGVVLATE